MEQLIHCAIVIVLIFSLLKEREQPKDKETRVIMNNPLAERQHEVTSNQMDDPLAERQPNRNDEAAIQNPEAVIQNPEAVIQNPEAINQNPEAINQKSTVIQNPEAINNRNRNRNQNPEAKKQSFQCYPNEKGEFKTLIHGESCKLKKSIFSFKEILSLIPRTTLTTGLESC